MQRRRKRMSGSSSTISRDGMASPDGHDQLSSRRNQPHPVWRAGGGARGTRTSLYQGPDVPTAALVPGLGAAELAPLPETGGLGRRFTPTVPSQTCPRAWDVVADC